MKPGRISGDFFVLNVRMSQNVFSFTFDSTANGLGALLCATILDSARKTFPCCWFCSSLFGRNNRSISGSEGANFTAGGAERSEETLGKPASRFWENRRRSWFCAQTFVKATMSTIKGERTFPRWRTGASIVKNYRLRRSLRTITEARPASSLRLPVPLHDHAVCPPPSPDVRNNVHLRPSAPQ